MVLAQVKELKQSQELLKKLVERIENPTQDLSITTLQHDLLDYIESLSVVTDYVNIEIDTPELKTYPINAVLKQQAQLLQAILAQLNSPAEQGDAAEEFEVTEGAIRRMSESLKGIVELNRTLQKESSISVDLATKTPLHKKENTTEKAGFFKRLFKR